MQPFEISLRNLKPGHSVIEWHADGEFFRGFENQDIKDADIDIVVEADYLECSLEVKCIIDGTVTVACDRCLGNLVLPVHSEFESSDQTDFKQDIYDYVCISIPMVRTHEDGGCDEETVKYLNK